MDGMLSAEEIDALLRAPLGSGPEEGEEINALMDELTGEKEVEKKGTAYNPIERTEGVVCGLKDQVMAMYERGYKDGKADAEREIDHEADYQRGLIDLWRGMKNMWTYHVQKEVFNVENLSDIFYGYTPSEALAKIREWEEKQAGDKRSVDGKIKIGDEVERMDSDLPKRRYAVTAISGDGYTFSGISDIGVSDFRLRCENYRRTGRHFPQIAEVINQMQEAVNE